MRKQFVIVLSILCVSVMCYAQTGKANISFNQLFPESKQNDMGLQKLNEIEKEALRAHVEGLLLKVVASSKSAGSYTGIRGKHWIQENFDSGSFITLEDGSLWKIDPVDNVYAMLWLSTSEITVKNSSSGATGYNYLLINTDDDEKVHAKYMGEE